ncbi:uncharacterized protein LOC129594609 [Paramacrobiotus metropolitanus]|uniref:uncharacterized protein LOC129594609 n=1 Tax=Paramacrobiotus metropolitanus TaxID=2943436 RepID=UPI002446396E|nr:uncharacterized protein LOC129594609 [Paramacrobiotus metropolitanus]
MDFSVIRIHLFRKQVGIFFYPFQLLGLLIPLVNGIVPFQDTFNDKLAYGRDNDYSYSTQVPQRCGIPNTLPSQPGQPAASEGVWYSYRQTPPIPVNSYYVDVGIQQTHEPGTGQAAETQWFQLMQYRSDNRTCTYSFWSGYQLADGRQLGEISSDQDGYIPRPDNYIATYYDFSVFGFDYQCAQPNYTSGFCDKPVFYIQTRERPDELSADVMQRIDDTVSSILKPYCLTLNDVPKTIYTKDLPLCPLIDPPDCFEKKIQGYSDLPVPSQKCGFPLAIPPWEKHIPEKVQGAWYLYRQIAPSQSSNILNNIYASYGLKDTAVPFTDIYAEYQWLPSSYYSTPDGGVTYICQYDHWISRVGADGSQMIMDYASESVPPYAPNPEIHVMAIVYDYNKYSIDYGCAKPNLNTRICEAPIIYVATLVRPTKLSSSDKADIDRILDTIFAPYCLSSADIPLQPYDDNRPDCILANPVGCANASMQVMGVDINAVLNGSTGR